MQLLNSPLTGRVEHFDRVREVFEACGFTVGGNWEYDHAYLDRHLDEQNKIWLRIPVRTVDGMLDPEVDLSHATVQLGTPFVLKHLYNEQLEREAGTGVFSGMFNQFQEPVDKDASLEDKWIEQAQSVLRDVESRFLS